MSYRDDGEVPESIYQDGSIPLYIYQRNCGSEHMDESVRQAKESCSVVVLVVVVVVVGGGVGGGGGGVLFLMRWQRERKNRKGQIKSYLHCIV